MALSHVPQRFSRFASGFEFDREAHMRRSLKMTLLTLLIGVAMFAVFFGLVAACDLL
jgi:hypothetical protein